MNILDSLYKSISNFFYGFNTTGDATCTIDDKLVDCSELQSDEQSQFISELEENGFHYNNDSEWWQRVWTTNTKHGKDAILEVRQWSIKGWKYLIFGDNDELIYEELLQSKPIRHGSDLDAL